MAKISHKLEFLVNAAEAVPEINNVILAFSIIWAIFVADSSRSFPNFYPFGTLLSHDRAKDELNKLQRINSISF